MVYQYSVCPREKLLSECDDCVSLDAEALAWIEAQFRDEN
jgi:hypothetical protein